jgi:hypothetical protein
MENRTRTKIDLRLGHVGVVLAVFEIPKLEGQKGNHEDEK